MKTKLKALLLIVVISSLSNQLFAQAFEKGNWNIDLGVGVGAYATTTTLTIPFPFLGNISRTTNDGAVSTIVPIGVEYGVSNRFGIGLQLGFSNYFIDDSTEVINFFTGEKTGQ